VKVICITCRISNQPPPSSCLAGVINLQSRDHIGLLLHGTFNASIPSDLIPKDRYRWKDRPKHELEAAADSATAHGQWLSRDTNEPLGGSNGRVSFSVAE
jgi:DNA-directed RNA polymerase I subunit RPA43